MSPYCHIYNFISLILIHFSFVRRNGKMKFLCAIVLLVVAIAFAAAGDLEDELNWQSYKVYIIIKIIIN